MSWLSIVITLLLEQVWPLPATNPVYGAVRQASGWALTGSGSITSSTTGRFSGKRGVR